MAIAAWHPFKTRRRVADLVRETICRSDRVLDRHEVDHFADSLRA